MTISRIIDGKENRITLTHDETMSAYREVKNYFHSVELTDVAANHNANISDEAMDVLVSEYEMLLTDNQSSDDSWWYIAEHVLRKHNII